MTTARDIVTRALGELLYIASGESPTASDAKDGLNALNDLIASWRTEGMLISYPPSVNWRGEWQVNTAYASNDGVSRSGMPYTCLVAHISSFNDKPGTSENTATYWTVTTDTDYTLDDTFTLPRVYHRGVIAMLAIEMAPAFQMTPSPGTIAKASQGKTALLAAFMPIQPVGVDAGLIRLPSQTWPVNVMDGTTVPIEAGDGITSDWTEIHW